MIAIERKKLEQVLDDLICASSYCNTYDAIDVVKEALAQPEQEPVAWMSDQDVGFKKSEFGATATVPLYTTPPKRPWVGLTDEEIEDCMEMSIQKTCRAIEAKLKEKNT